MFPIIVYYLLNVISIGTRQRGGGVREAAAMRNNQFKVRILIVGPQNVGKTRLANFLADMSLDLPEHVRPTDSLRILEYDVGGVNVNGVKSSVDVQLWDTSGNENCLSCWPVFRKNADGIVFVYATSDETDVRKLENMHNYFIGQQNFNLRACLVCSFSTGEYLAKLPAVFSKISHINVNLDSNADKFRQEFSKYILSVVGTLN